MAMGCAKPMAPSEIYDTSAARRGLRIDTAGQYPYRRDASCRYLTAGAVTTSGLLNATAGIQVAGNGITYPTL